jgi:hypothetical protein
MREYDKYFENEEDLEKIFVDYKDIIETYHSLRNQFLSNIITSEEDLKSALSFYTGAYQTFDGLLATGNAYKESQEDFEALKIRNESAGKTKKEGAPTDAMVKTTSHYAVRNYIKIRNLLETFVNGCDKGINTCQTLLKYVRKEENRTK